MQHESHKSSSPTAGAGNCCTFNNTRLSAQAHRPHQIQFRLPSQCSVHSNPPVKREKVLSKVSSKIPGSCRGWPQTMDKETISTSQAGTIIARSVRWLPNAYLELASASLHRFIGWHTSTGVDDYLQRATRISRA